MADVVSPAGSWRDRRVLVTGAAGFVGSRLARGLAGAGAMVVAFDRHQGPDLDALSSEGNATAVLGSVTDQALLEKTLNEQGITDIFHLAAQAIVGLANRSPVSTFEANIQGTWCVLEAARTATNVERVVVASSDKAYGTQPKLPYTEDMPLLGLNPYDASKACTDILAQSYARAYGLPVVVSRCANIYGGGDRNFSRLVPGTILAALQGRGPVIRSDGTPVRDYIHVDDAVAAYMTLGEQALKDPVRGQAFNFGANRPVNVLELTRMILDACGRAELEPDVQGTATNEIDEQYLDSSRARAVLGWGPRVDLEEGLRRSVDDYRAYFDASGFPGESS